MRILLIFVLFYPRRESYCCCCCLLVTLTQRSQPLLQRHTVEVTNTFAAASSSSPFSPLTSLPPPPPLRPPRPPLLLPLTPPFLPLLPFLLLVLSSTFSAARSDSVCGAWGGQYEGLQITTRRTHCGLPGWPVPREGFSAAGSSDISAPSFVRYLRGYRRRFDLDVSFETEVIWAERESVPTQGPGGTPVAGCIRVQFRRCVMDAPLFIRGGVHARLGWSALFDCVGVWRRR